MVRLSILPVQELATQILLQEPFDLPATLLLAVLRGRLFSLQWDRAKEF